MDLSQGYLDAIASMKENGLASYYDNSGNITDVTTGSVTGSYSNSGYKGINYYQQYAGLKDREEQHQMDVYKLYADNGYYSKDKAGHDVFDHEKFNKDYWDSTGQQNPQGIYQQHNNLMNSYYADLTNMGITGNDGKPINSKNLPLFSGSWHQSDKTGSNFCFGTPDAQSFAWMGNSSVMGQTQSPQQTQGNEDMMQPMAPLSTLEPTNNPNNGYLAFANGPSKVFNQMTRHNPIQTTQTSNQNGLLTG